MREQAKTVQDHMSRLVRMLQIL